MASKFYPKLDSLVSIDSLPEQLSFFESGMDNILSGFYFKDLQVSNASSSNQLTYT